MTTTTIPPEANPAPTTPTIISAKEAAAMLGIHLTTLYEAARRGEVPCRIIGRRFVFVREVLEAWLLGQVAK
jgi:excisionase family DNA binding protein